MRKAKPKMVTLGCRAGKYRKGLPIIVLLNSMMMKGVVPSFLLLFLGCCVCTPSFEDDGNTTNNYYDLQRHLRLDSDSQLVYFDSDGETLLYDGYRNQNGPGNNKIRGGSRNTVPDYSNAGYKGKNKIFVLRPF